MIRILSTKKDKFLNKTLGSTLFSPLSEWSPRFSGYLAGAIDAAFEGCSRLTLTLVKDKS